MAKIKEPCARADGTMLLNDTRVLDGHLPAGKVHHPCAECQVLFVERRALHQSRVSAS